MKIDEVRDADRGRRARKTRRRCPAPQVRRRSGTDDKTYEVVTPNENAAEVRRRSSQALGDKLKVELPQQVRRRRTRRYERGAGQA